MKTLLLFIAVILQFTHVSSSVARLGEDEDQCEDRYGFAKNDVGNKMSPLISGDGTVTRTYFYQGWRIRIGFLDGVAVREEYWKITGPGRNVTIADYEMNAVLDGEKGTGTWLPKGTTLSIDIPKMLQDKVREVLMGTFWVRSDGIATAMIDSVRFHLAFESLAAIQHDEAIKQANEQKQRTTVPVF